MGQDEVTQSIIEEGSVWSLQESSQTSHAMAAEGQGGAGQPPVLSAPLLAPSGTEGAAGRRIALMGGSWAVLGESRMGQSRGEGDGKHGCTKSR